MEILRQPRVATRRYQPRLISKQSRAKVSCLFGAKPPATPPAPQPSFRKIVEVVLTAAAGGLVTVSIAYLANVFTLPSKLDLMTLRLDQQSMKLDKALDQQSMKLDKARDQQSMKLDKALDQQSMKLDKVLSESIQYRREVAELRGGFKILLQKVPDVKS